MEGGCTTFNGAGWMQASVKSLSRNGNAVHEMRSFPGTGPEQAGPHAGSQANGATRMK
jgi:hypothetical protein